MSITRNHGYFYKVSSLVFILLNLISYSCWAEWTIETVDSSSHMSGNNYASIDIAVDSNNKVHISYYDTVDKCLMYVTNVSGTWSKEVVDSSSDDIGYYCSIAIDSNNKIHISYYDATNKNLKYITNSLGSWSYITLDSTGDVGKYTSIAVDRNNKLHIVYYDESNTNLKYTTNLSGDWAYEVIDLDGASWNTSTAIDTDNNVHVSYGGISWNLKYARKVAPNVWATGTVDTSDWITDGNGIAIDSNNKVHISYHRSAESRSLKYATNASGTWVLKDIDTTYDSGWYSSIAIDSNNYAHISYIRSGDVMYTTNTTGWGDYDIVEKKSSSYSFVSDTTSIVIDSNNNIHIVYDDDWRGYLKYATNVPSSVNTAPIVSNVTISGSSGNITITYNLEGADNNTCSITVQYQGGSVGTTWTTATTSGTTTGITPGTGKTIIWKSGIDQAGQSASDYKIKIIPSDGKTTGTAGESSAFSVDNREITEFTGRIAYHTYSEYMATPNSDDGHIFIFDISSKIKTNLTSSLNVENAMNPHFSPDGMKLIFMAIPKGAIRDRNSLEIYIYDFTTEQLQRLTYNSIPDEDPKFSPNGSKIVFKQSDQIWVMNLDGSEASQITFSTEEKSGPYYSPDGTKIVYWTGSGTNADIWLMNSDGSLATALINQSGLQEYYPVYRRYNNNTDLLYTRWESTEDHHDKIYNFSGHTGNSERLAINESGLNDSDPFPINDTYIGFSSDRLGSNRGYDIYIGDTITGDVFSFDEMNHSDSLHDLGGCFSSVMGSGSNSPPIVTNVTTSGLSGDIIVTYDLADANNDSSFIAVQYQGGSIGTASWSYATKTGANTGIMPGTGKSIVWNSGIDQTNQEASNYKIKLTPYDTSIGVAGESETFSVDNKLPSITDNTPTGTNVAVTDNTTVTFNDEMSQTATQGAFSISPSVSGSFSWNSNALTFNPTADLALSTTYTVTISTVAEDDAGNNLTSLYSWQFTTEAPPSGDNGGGGGGGGGGCFIATAAYGNPMAEEVRTLCEFRDKHLLTNKMGRKFVGFYYKYGPYIADWIKGKECIKKITRCVLKPIIWMTKGK